MRPVDEEGTPARARGSGRMKFVTDIVEGKVAIPSSPGPRSKGLAAFATPPLSERVDDVRDCRER